ncbi:UDP-Glycosyltransferase/glycogen phosphorylase [Lenzites betulinus]|nr:UDP-Glycosyltransferase/glycogen phosphorylase [Lenzites betulinus]
MATTHKHLFVYVSYFWGHARPLSLLVARIAKMRDIMITFIVVKSLHARIEAEVASEFRLEEKHLLEKIRLMGVVPSRIIAIEDGTKTYEASGAPGALKVVWSRICNDEPLTCAKTGTQYEALPTRPSAALLDFFAMDGFEAVRELSGSTVKLYAWFACAVSSFAAFMGPDPLDMVKAEAERVGRPIGDVAFDVGLASQTHSVIYQLFWTGSGQVLPMPFGPSIYDYEAHPQQYQMDRELIGHIFLRIPRLTRQVDGLVSFDAAEYQPRATAILKQFYEARSQKTIFTGPLLSTQQQGTLSQSGNDIMAFLNKNLQTHGEHSVIYISFGSFFGPSDPAKLWVVLDVIMEKGIPFVMTHVASYAGQLPDDVKAKIAEYGNAIVSDWAPQATLLDHPATGLFLTHCGHNSVLESINAGVPMIAWPISVDQPLNALYLSEEVDVAYELIEVRHGIALGPIYRNGRKPVGTIDAVKEETRAILDKAFGADGAAKRARLQTMMKTLQAAWGEDGIARREVAAFVDDL